MIFLNNVSSLKKTTIHLLCRVSSSLLHPAVLCSQERLQNFIGHLSRVKRDVILIYVKFSLLQTAQALTDGWLNNSENPLRSHQTDCTDTDSSSNSWWILLWAFWRAALCFEVFSWCSWSRVRREWAAKGAVCYSRTHNREFWREK